jgi:hypothetical protein
MAHIRQEFILGAIGLRKFQRACRYTLLQLQVKEMQFVLDLFAVGDDL